jgi:UDP-N-acetylmuramate dehydrogenase
MSLVSKSQSFIRGQMLEILRSRRKKFPRKLPNCGSVFKSSPNLYKSLGPPGYIIEKLGFSGLTIGGAQVSSQHSNFIVNNGNATSKDIIELVKLIHSKVLLETNFLLEAEPLFVDYDGLQTPLHLVEH